jgi:hypothetical protein
LLYGNANNYRSNHRGDLFRPCDSLAHSEWWQMKNDQIREVNEAERPAIVKPKRFYKGKGL